MVKYKRIDNTNTVRFVTLSCFHQMSLFKTQFAILTFIKHLRNIKAKYNFKLYGYVIMPDHVHLIILPPEKTKLAIIINELKSLTAREVLHYWKIKNLNVLKHLVIKKDGVKRHAFWQRRYYDHNCRTRDIVLTKLEYCHNNPIKAGLVETPEQWRWSSYRACNGLEGVAIEIDELEY